METVYLKTFVEVLNTGSISKAAENQYITPSAASRRIKFLEDQYGYLLLDRSGPRLVPTEAGKLVFGKALKLLQLEEEILLGLKGMEERAGILFCCTNSFGITHLPQVFSDFMLKNPDTAKLKFFFDQPDNIVKGLRNNSYNLAVFEHCIYCKCFQFDEFSTYSLPDDEAVFISSPALCIDTPNTTIDALFEFTLYGQNEGACVSKFLASNLKSMGRNITEFKNHIIVDDLQMIITAVLAGNGIACISKGVVEKQVKATQLVQHHVEGFTHVRKRTLAIGKSQRTNSATENLKNSILEYFDVSHV